MSLKNFGGVLEYAIELEKQDASFFSKAAANPECSTECRNFFGKCRNEAQKNAKTLVRARQENVTEMILEPVQGLDERTYALERPDPDTLSQTESLQAAQQIEENAQRFYLDAAERIQNLSDVGRTFKRLAKKRKERVETLNTLL